VYATYIPSFGGYWSYVTMSRKPFRLNRKIDGLFYPKEIILLKEL
jgi:hypothetical protein